MITRGENNELKKETIEKSSSDDKKDNSLLVLSYFDRIRGPSILYCEEKFDHFELRNVLDVLDIHFRI